MTEVAFHFGAPDKLAYTCRLLRKAVGAGAKLTVLADDALTARLDAGLWGLGAVDFVPHCQASASDSLIRHSPVVFTNVLGAPATLRGSVLVQLQHPAPQEVIAFERVIEVVSLEDDDRAMARQRWKAYVAQGMAIQRYDVAAREAG